MISVSEGLEMERERRRQCDPPKPRKPVIRSSSMPLFMVCGNAILNPDKILFVEQENEAALAGTLVHGLLEKLIRTGEYDLMSLKDRCTEEDFDRAGLLFNNGLTVWREAQPYMPSPQVEVEFEAELSHCLITGHIDVLQQNPANAYILDWKTGRQHDDHYHQMAAYAFGAWSRAGRPPRYTVFVTVVYLEDNAVQSYTFSVENLLGWEREVAAQVLSHRYVAGRKCAGCPLQGGCPAYRQYVAGALTSLREDTTIPMATWGDLSPEERGQIVDKMYVVEKAIDRAKLGLRNLVKSKGAVDVGGGKEYVLVEQEERQVDPVKALPILNKRIGKAAVDRQMRLALDGVLGEFAGKAARGQKTKARKELFEELDAAGAIVRSKTTKMWRRPKGEKTLEVTE